MKRVLMRYAVVSLLLPATAHANAYEHDTLPGNATPGIGSIQYGIASFYHNKFEGRKTATGEIFSQKKISAASNRFPLNCWVKVTNVSNKRSIILRINDRMHPRNKRLIDLSHAAALKLNYTGRGLTRVRVEYLGKKKPSADMIARDNK